GSRSVVGMNRLQPPDPEAGAGRGAGHVVPAGARVRAVASLVRHPQQGGRGVRDALELGIVLLGGGITVRGSHARERTRPPPRSRCDRWTGCVTSVKHAGATAPTARASLV